MVAVLFVLTALLPLLRRFIAIKIYCFFSALCVSKNCVTEEYKKEYKSRWRAQRDQTCIHYSLRM